MELEEQGEKLRVFLRLWDGDIFRRVCVATLDRYNDDSYQVKFDTVLTGKCSWA